MRPHAKQALAWQVFSLVYICIIALVAVCAGLTLETSAIIVCIAILPSVLFTFIATIKALACEPYGYPLVKRFVEY